MILGQSFLNNYANKKIQWGFGELSKFIMDTKYARLKSQVQEKYRFSEHEKEGWHDIVGRNIEGIFDLMYEHIPRHRIKRSRQRALARSMYNEMFDFIWTPAGRPMRNIGSILLQERGGACLNNCSFVNLTKGDPIKGFKFIIDMSMNGVGVGVKIGDTKHKIYKSRRGSEVFIIPDTTEGWIEGLEKLLNSYLKGSQKKVKFDYSLIRPVGSPIRTGGIHEGFEPLRDMYEDIRWVLEGHDKLCTRALADISNLIGRCVVNGGQRRTALILLADEDNKVFKDLKDDTIYPYRFEKKIAYTSNNSYLVESDDFDFTIISDAVVKNGNGEPAVILIKNKDFGRLIDGEDFRDMLVEGTNPCAEIFLENFELCNLMEININKLSNSGNQMLRTLWNVVFFAKIISHVPSKWEETNNVVVKNRRIGISLTGVVEFLSKTGMSNEDFAQKINRIYRIIRKVDKEISKLLRCNESIRLTTVKPSGTVSLLMGTTSGIHAGFGEYVIRHVEIPKNSPYNDYYSSLGYHIEPSKTKDNVNLIAFPMVTEGIKTQKEQTIEEQFELVALMQKWYSDNAISVTINFKDHEVHKIPFLLFEYQDRIKSASFLKYDGHVYEQAPFMPINKQQYEDYLFDLARVIIDEDDLDHILIDSVDSRFCTTDYCELIE